MNKNLTDILVDDLFDLTNEAIPEPVLLQTKTCVLDFLGVALAGESLAGEKCKRYLDLFDSKQSEATVIGYNRKASLHNAAFVNGYNAHIAELDDGHRYCNVHLGATVIPAALAVAEYENLEWGDLLRGVVIGYEAAIRLGRAIQPSHKNLGFHVSGTCGTIGAAMGISAALKFSKAQMKDAISSAVANASGILEVIEDDSELKPYNIGRASLDGLTAAYVARAGIKGPNDVVGGKRGFFALMSETNDPSSLNRDPNGVYGIEMIYRKPYAACRHCHAPIEAAINLKEKHNIISSDIEAINVSTYLLAVKGHDHINIQGITSAKMSIPYSVAVAFETGKAGLNEFLPEYIDNKKISALTKKVKVIEDNELSALVPEKRAAIVEIITKSGKSYIERADYPKGEPENPMSVGDVEQKFISMATYAGKTETEAKGMIQKFWNIENDCSGLFDML